MFLTARIVYLTARVITTVRAIIVVQRVTFNNSGVNFIIPRLSTLFSDTQIINFILGLPYVQP